VVQQLAGRAGGRTREEEAKEKQVLQVLQVLQEETQKEQEQEDRTRAAAGEEKGMVQQGSRTPAHSSIARRSSCSSLQIRQRPGRSACTATTGCTAPERHRCPRGR
jgi:hypothetical protein